MIFVVEPEDIERQIITINKWLTKSKIPRAYKINLMMSYHILANSDDPEDKELFNELYDVLSKLKV